MKINSVPDLLTDITALFKEGKSKEKFVVEPLMRGLLFSVDQMAHYARALAATHEISRKSIPAYLIDRLEENERVLNAVRKLLVAAVRDKQAIAPAGEWLIDNFYLIEEQIHTAKRHLPKSYSMSLPQLASIAQRGTTRVYDIVQKFISHCDGRVDEERLSSYITAYQKVQPLRLGELWAVPIMLRLTLIENLRRLSASIAHDRIDVNKANYWADILLDTAKATPGNLFVVVGDLARSGQTMTSAFLSELNRRLMGRGEALTAALQWCDLQLKGMNRSTQGLINAELQKQAVDQVSVSNSINSLRLISDIDWRDFVEANSIVEDTLKQDPAKIYSKMNFPTRDAYRHVVEQLARKAKMSETDIAKSVLDLSIQKAKETGNGTREAHIGYFLVDEGELTTRKTVGINITILDQFRRVLSKNRLGLYLSSMIAITAIISALVIFLRDFWDEPSWLATIITILLVLSVSQLAVSIVNFFSTLIAWPRLLPRMDFSEEIPEEFRTLVVVPCMLSDIKSVEELVDDLELRFLANRDPNLQFALLSDFTDAPSETLPNDEALLALACKGIRDLKHKYETTGKEQFFLLQRPRLWQPYDKIWMGYERKRGKLGALNELLTSGISEPFSKIIGNVKALVGATYVITLDADTQLPRGAAWKLVASMAHPLNRAIYNPQKRRVTKGYGILQPRVSVSMPNQRSSFYTRLHGNEPGIDPYTRATSDVYQDLFAEGSFIGKGIYDPKVFELTLQGKLPENRILSHDLLEGCYLRSGLLSDVELFENYPSNYAADMKRRARWIRGDWQILPWSTPLVPGADEHLHRNPLSALSRWKIFDNLRRSLVPAALTLLIILGWTVLQAPLFWTLAITSIILLPIFISVVWDALRKSSDVRLEDHINQLLHNTSNTIAQTFFSLICLPHEAYINLKSISQAIWRMLISHRHLLQWNPSMFVERNTDQSIAGYFRKMWAAPALAICILAFEIIVYPDALFSVVPIVVLWGISPTLVWLISQPRPRQEAILNPSQHIVLRLLARKTWAYFERFVTEEDNWLPPDNYQQFPEPEIAHRTSPTNIGLSLLANISAHDFGFLSKKEFVTRASNTLATLKSLQRFQGHFYNWYDTQTLVPLLPRYISTVDSGNLAGHMLCFRQGIFELLHAPLLHTQLFVGINATLQALEETLKKEEKAKFVEFEKSLKAALEANPCEPIATTKVLKTLKSTLEDVVKNLGFEPNSLKAWWANSLQNQLTNALDDLNVFSPWMVAFPKEFALEATPDSYSLMTLKKKIDSIVSLIPDSQNRQPLEADFLKIVLEKQVELKEKVTILEQLGSDCVDFADMEWSFLYDKSRHLLSIGYRVDDKFRDTGFYDLLASEVRLCVFAAIAQGKLPEEAWFALGRQLTNVDGKSILLSWSGSMFEYLMPVLVMPDYPNTLLGETCKAAVQRQISYGTQRGVPWGISESAYNNFDAAYNYQYRSFGVPGLGLKRGLEADLVVAPYATMMSLMVAPLAAFNNIERMKIDGFEGPYGFFEAVDFTPARLQRGENSAIIQSFMAHHQGMSLLSIDYILNDQPMQRRFEAEPQYKATLLLLQERVPKSSSFFAHTTHLEEASPAAEGQELRVFHTPNTTTPEIQLLSNGRYQLMLTNAGSSFSRCGDTALTRWREDTTRDPWGLFCYINDIDSGKYWSAAYQPTINLPEAFQVVFSQGRADFFNKVNDIESHIEVVISPEDDIEIRRLRICNKGKKARTLELTSFAEVVLAAPADDEAQQAFSNLFVETEILEKERSILCSRRPRKSDQQPPWMFHTMLLRAGKEVEVSYETDRLRFMGHGNTPSNPEAMRRPGKLSGSEGSVLDPIVSIRHKITLAPDESISFDLILGIGPNRDAIVALIEKYSDGNHTDRAFELAWTHSHVVLRQINATEEDENLFMRLAGSVIYSNSKYRAASAVINKNHRQQSGLWGYSISGDLPIVLLQVETQQNISLIRQIIKAHTYWRLKGLQADLVILNEDHDTYRQEFLSQIQGLIPPDQVDKKGGIFVRSGDQMSAEDKTLFHAIARVIIHDTDGSLKDILDTASTEVAQMPLLSQNPDAASVSASIDVPTGLQFFNGYGGFSADGKEYVIVSGRRRRTPLPWVNVLANASFGTVISESGQAYTWIENAHEMRLTPWNNDPVDDIAGEQFYIRDEETGQYWAAAPLPQSGFNSYITTHGFGYSTFEHIEFDILSTMTVFVDEALPLKYIHIRLKNKSAQQRKLSMTGYIEWVLGDLRQKTAPNIITSMDPVTGSLFAENHYSSGFDDQVAFFDCDETISNFTCDRSEFIGRNKGLRHPAAMLQKHLSGRKGAALDPCAAIQLNISLAAGEEKVLVFRLGAEKNLDKARALVKATRGIEYAENTLSKVKENWEKILGTIQLKSPDAATNILANGWLVYQALACRVWARSGFYQSGGAFGFRDQLQDVLALMYARPDITKAQILLACAHQFEEGDVQHWWHPPEGRGVRTRITDDLLWLPYVVGRYVQQTGDTDILKEEVPFIKGRLLNAEEDSYYDLPEESPQRGTVYEHCVRAINKGATSGQHGLPLMGTGDWNDGMDKVGEKGKGESVWLGWFLLEVLEQFQGIATQQNDDDFEKSCQEKATSLRESINKNAWDGAWFRRAYFDDGSPLGSSSNTDCQIDSIAQSWSVLSGGGDEKYTHQALESAGKRLIKEDGSIICLLDPAFDKGPEDPGYIKGYVPGVRENGGQYTHAAIWLIMAFAKHGDHERAWDLLSGINPINHGDSEEKIATFMAEPYVMAGDVYGVAPHIGRCGWTWYTGSAGWMYQLIIEHIIGMKREGDKLNFKPSLPAEWPELSLDYQFGNSLYSVTISQQSSLKQIEIQLDNTIQAADFATLQDDGKSHIITVKLPFSKGVEKPESQ
ncbi:MAG: glucoamylase family protein [Chitinophagaceae bacterium]